VTRLALLAAAATLAGACERRARVAVVVPPPATGANAAASSGTPDPLEVRFLGVAGFLLRSGDQAVLTAPLYTRPSITDVTVGAIASDAALVQASLPAGALDSLRAIVSGHAHYDHLLDTPALLQAAPGATLYSNTAGQHILAALAPDRAPSCPPSPPASPSLPRTRVVALDDPAASVVDYRPCPADRPAGAPLAGAWTRVPGSRVRLYAICSAHPDQLGPYHFGLGTVDADQCALPTVADNWREGRTLALLIDFLDACDRPVYRIYYQDAPTTLPVGLPPADVLADKRIDLALLCVGNYDKVVDAPAATLAALAPRFALGGHWEDFFRPASDPTQPLPLTDVAAWTARAQAVLPSTLLPQPGDQFAIAFDPAGGHCL
jgi:L-ascorbate metabolism protein UlaG (beta-lactamase superfamily)